MPTSLIAFRIEEVLTKVIDYPTACSVLLALEAAFSHSSISRVNQLCIEFTQLKKGSSIVEDFIKKFHNLCDQLVRSENQFSTKISVTGIFLVLPFLYAILGHPDDDSTDASFLGFNLSSQKL
ncbi:hypothetical protein ACS0TY_011527 [Phlomoides rotata]